MAKLKPSWIVDVPWSITLPADQPISVNDLKGHDQILRGHGPNNQTRLWRIGRGNRCVLPYLIPQSQGLTSRFVLAWAFVAPLVQIADPSVVLPLEAVRRLVPEYDPLQHVVMRQETLADEALREFFHTRRSEPCIWENELCVVLKVREEDVAVAPIDTPVHPFTDACDDTFIP